MRIKIPKYSWIKIVDKDGGLLRQVCIQEELIVITEGGNREKSASEISPTYDTMAHDGGVRP